MRSVVKPSLLATVLVSSLPVLGLLGATLAGGCGSTGTAYIPVDSPLRPWQGPEAAEEAPAVAPKAPAAQAPAPAAPVTPPQAEPARKSKK